MIPIEMLAEEGAHLRSVQIRQFSSSDPVVATREQIARLRRAAGQLRLLASRPLPTG